MAIKKVSQESIGADDKVARLLALLVIKDVEDKQEQALLLNSAGFTAGEIAQILRVGDNYVHVALHRTRPKRNAVKKRL
jgi:DNA-directed RNA polymerase specialized sigma24 family protein